MTSTQKRRDTVFTILAVISFLADFLTLGEFLRSETFLSFWTFQWFISIVFVALLAVGGFVFLAISGNKDVADAVLVFYGIFYTVASLVLYVFFGYRQTLEQVSAGDYFGFLILFVIATAVGAFGVSYDSVSNLRYPSYGFAIANLLYVFMLINRYVLEGASFKFWQFAGEVIILLVGIVVFLFQFFWSEEG